MIIYMATKHNNATLKAASPFPPASAIKLPNPGPDGDLVATWVNVTWCHWEVTVSLSLSSPSDG